jgi:hypothetical protein
MKGTKVFEKDGKFKDLRAVFSVHPEPFTVLARKEANASEVSKTSRASASTWATPGRAHVPPWKNC